MSADSFSVVSIQCVVGALGASFLYKCPASRGSSLRQHGFLVSIWGNYGTLGRNYSLNSLHATLIDDIVCRVATTT